MCLRAIMMAAAEPSHIGCLIPQNTPEQLTVTHRPFVHSITKTTTVILHALVEKRNQET